MSVLSQPGALPTARELGEQLDRLAQREADPTHSWRRMKRSGRPCSGWASTPPPGRTWSRGALTDPTVERLLALRHGTAPGLRCLAMMAHTLWCLGYPAQAVQRSQEAMAQAQALAHPYSLAVAQHCATFCITAAARHQRSRYRPRPS